MRNSKTVHLHVRATYSGYGYILCDMKEEKDLRIIDSTNSIYKTTCVTCAEIKLRKAITANDQDTINKIYLRFPSLRYVSNARMGNSA